MTYVSDEFRPKVPQIVSWPGAACVVANSDASSTLWYVYTRDKGEMVCATAPLDDIGRGGTAQPTAWSVTDVSVDGWKSPGPAAISACGLTARPAPLVAWNQAVDAGGPHAGLWSAEYGGGDNPKTWGQRVQLRANSSGTPALTPSWDSAGVSCVAWGTDTVLIACSAVHGYGVYLGVFSAGQRDAGSGHWVPVHQYGWDAATFSSVVSGVTSTGDWLSMDWFVTGDPAATASQARPPATYLAIALAPTVGDANTPVVGYVRLRFDDQDVPYVDSSDDVVWDAYPDSTPLTVARDPAGRLRTYQSGKDALTVVTHSTLSAPTAPANGGHALPVVTTENLPAPSGGGVPTVASFTDLGHAHETVTQATGLDGELHTFSCDQAPAWEVILYGGDTAPSPQPRNYTWVPTPVGGWARSFGLAQSIENQVTLNRAPQDPQNPQSPPIPSNVVLGIVDGPIPVANASLSSAADVGDVTYSSDSTVQVDHKVTLDWSVGFKTDGHPASGGGPAWNISLSGGTGQTTDRMTETIDGSAATMTSPAAPAKPPAAGYEMLSSGRVLCQSPGTQYRAFRWLASVGPQLAGSPSVEPASGCSRVYGKGPDGHLLFFLGNDDWWGMDDVSWEADRDAPVVLAGNPVAGAHGAADGDHGVVYARGVDEHLLRFEQGADGWACHDVTAAGGTALVSDPAPVMIGATEHVFTLGYDGHVMDQWPTGTDPTGPWTAADITHTQTPDFAAASDPPAVVSPQAIPNADGTTWSVSVSFTAPNRHAVLLYNPSYPNPSTWTHSDYTQTAGPSCTVVGDVVNGSFGVLAAGGGQGGTQGDLVRWLYTGANGWHWEDVSADVGNVGALWVTLTGDPAPCRSAPVDGLLAVAVHRQQDDHLLVLTRDGTAPWTAVDLTVDAVDGTVIMGDVSFPDSQHVYATATDGHLLCFTADTAGVTDAAWTLIDVSVACGSSGAAVIHDSTSPVAGQAPSYTAILPAPKGQNGFSYPLFGPVAGDLTSYTEYSWNQRMRQVAEGSPTAQLYAGDDYVAHMKDVAAYPLTATKAMTNTYVGGSVWGHHSFEQITSSFVESSWTIDFECYVGGGWGGVANPAGALTGLAGMIGLNESFEFLVGGSLHSSHTTTVTGTTDWGVALTGPGGSTTWGPPPQVPPPPGAAATWTFDIYLFPPPVISSGLPETYWATELIAGLTLLQKTDPSLFDGVDLLQPDTVDPGSGPWKIMYVVTDYTATPTLTIDPATPPAAGSTIRLSGRYYGMSSGDTTPGLVSLTLDGRVLASKSFSLDPNGNFGDAAFEDAVELALPDSLQTGEYTLMVSTGDTTGTTQFSVT